jgi:hypothetical protein
MQDEVLSRASRLVSLLQAEKADSLRAFQQRLRNALDALAEEAEAAARSGTVDEELAAIDEAVRALSESAGDTATAERAALQEEVENLRSALEASRAECAALESSNTDVATLQKTVRAAQAEAAAAATELQQLRTAFEEAEETRAQAEAQWLQSALVPLELQLDAARRLTAAATVDEVLGVLVDTIAQDLSRAALFSVRDGRLEGVRQIGFELASDISKLVVPLGLDSVLSDAVSSGRVQGLLGPGLSAGTRKLFGGSPEFALVVPVVVKGEPLAVVYADDSGQTSASISPEQRMQLAELLLCQIVPRLPKLLRAERAVASLEQHASQLLARIEQSYAADRQKEVPAPKLQARVQKHLKEARGIYEESAGSSSEATAIFEDQLTAALRLHSGTPFGRDLATAAGGAAQSTHSDYQTSASRA